MTVLSVNLNKVALLRNSRGGNRPDVITVAKDCIAFGADGITVHPRPDRRHVLPSDVAALKQAIAVELNVEGFPSKDFLKMVLEIEPAQVTLVPDAPEALTSNAGWDAIAQREFLSDVVAKLHQKKIRVSLFLEPSEKQIVAAKQTCADRIELYTEAYAEMFEDDAESAIRPYVAAAKVAASQGLGLNAGHDLNLSNLGYLVRALPGLKEVSVGHALICDALYLGLRDSIQRYRRCLEAVGSVF